MKFSFLVNEFKTLVASQTTAMLMEAAVVKGHDIYVFGVADLGLTPEGQIVAAARHCPAGQLEGVAECVAFLKESTPQTLDLSDSDVVLLRTNPARDKERQWAHDTAMSFMRMLRDRGTPVLNDPDGLIRASNKLYLGMFPPEVYPRTMVSCQPKEIHEFVTSMDETCVLKPLQGTRGRDVFFVHPGKYENLNQIIDVLTRDGFAMVQSFLPEAVRGDIRVVTMDGKILEVDGKPAAVARVPKTGDLRSNIHAGGKAEPPKITDAIREVVSVIGPRLVEDGIFLAGLDFIGNKVVEINVFSTGGFRDAEKFTGIPFSELVIEELEARFG